MREHNDPGYHQSDSKGVRAERYRKSTKPKANVPAPLPWHKVLHQQLSANTFNRIIRLRISVCTVLYHAVE
jgi:hypothetical protein